MFAEVNLVKYVKMKNEILKTEWIYKNEYLRKTDAEISIIKWIETWYNRNRRHSALNYKTIKE
tara:strand:+ start:12774 stop:12962 length:189 start_codon:yes stop_codon:yes gene_type:complete